jgi:hypothetical protein
MTVPVKRRIEKCLGPLFDPLYLFYLLVDDFKSWKYFLEWFSSFRPGKSLIPEAKPWLPFEAVHWLEIYLLPHMKVFEYGSGGSTIFLSERAGQVFSVEHDRAWYVLVSKALTQRGLNNCWYQLHEPQTIGETFSSVGNSRSSRLIYDDYYPGMTVDDYVRSIDILPDRTFDLVLVDGRARTACIEHAISKIRPGGYLMLDNSNNADVAEIVHTLLPYPHTVFRGIAPGWPPRRWSNTVWRIAP